METTWPSVLATATAPALTAIDMGPSALPTRTLQRVRTVWLGVKDSSDAGVGFEELPQPASTAAATRTAPARHVIVSLVMIRV
jgi:hypothetical protein